VPASLLLLEEYVDRRISLHAISLLMPTMLSNGVIAIVRRWLQRYRSSPFTTEWSRQRSSVYSPLRMCRSDEREAVWLLGRVQLLRTI
jgi:hypothetical protein